MFEEEFIYIPYSKQVFLKKKSEILIQNYEKECW